MQDLIVLGLEGSFSFNIMLKISKKSINSFIGLILTIVNLKIIFKKLLSPVNLLKP